MELVTPRLMLRDLEPEDAAPLASMWADAQVTRNLGGPRSEAEVLEALQKEAALNPPPRLALWPVVEKASGEVIGQCGFKENVVDMQPVADFTCIFMRKAWGRGYANEAARAVVDYVFKVLHEERVIALIEPGDDVSVRVALKVGMRFEKNTLRTGERLVWLYSLNNPQQRAEPRRVDSAAVSG